MPYRPTEKTEARKKAQYDLLLTTALTLVARDGFQNLTIATLAEQAQVAIGTVYKYFDSKADVCAAVFRRATEKEVAQVQLAAFPEEVGLTCEQRLANTVQVFSERALLGYRLAYALVEALIQEGINDNTFCPQDVDVSAAALVGTLSETLLGSIGSHISEAKAIDQQKLISDIQGFCLRAVK